MGRRIRHRHGNGRFRRAPSLEGMGLLRVCPDPCGRVLVNDGTPLDPRYPSTCPSCGRAIDPNTGRLNPVNKEGA